MLKKNVIVSLCFACFSFILFLGCQVGSPDTINKGSKSDTPSVYISGTPEGNIMAFSADVTVTQQNNRKINQTVKVQEYRMRARIIDGILNTRIDYPAGKDGEQPRSIITDGTNAVYFDTNSLKILNRVPLASCNATYTGSIDRLMGRVDISNTQESLRKLSFDISTDSLGKYLVCSAPSALLPKIQTVNARTTNAFRLVYDMENETFQGSIQEESTPSGEVITTNTNYIYQKVNNQPILVGQIVQEQHVVPEVLPAGSDVLPQVIDLTQIKEVSNREIEEAQETGVVARVDPPVGDRTNPNYTITTITQYNNITLGDVPVSDFRVVALEGK